eukprot:TRINITY_DN2421_c1_g5_i1.p1 TRINITY_DN2421_c1_g5~~TRINITY_DN2421_c1_g5_i1.p1  ORF type:complete len:398 (+),score=106.16 TRINITY_DN2421_c1_g5_i1:58-1194(+)
MATQRAPAAAAALLALVLVRPCLADEELPRSDEKCVNKFVDAVRDEWSESTDLFRACFSPKDLLDPNKALVIKTYTGDTDMCADRCLAFSVLNVTKDNRMAPHASVIALLLPDAAPPTCHCITEFLQAQQDGCERRDDALIWNIPLNCAASDTESCSQKNCERQYGCCYAAGTLHENPFLEVSQMTAQLVFFVVLLAFATQLVVYVVYRIAQWFRRPPPATQVANNDLRTTFLPSVTPEHYASFLESLPDAVLNTDSLRAGTCTVCLDEYTAGATRCIELPDCHHIFHLHCICDFAVHEVRQGRPALCPNCRAKIYTPSDDAPSEDPPKRSPSGSPAPPHPLAPGSPPPRRASASSGGDGGLNENQFPPPLSEPATTV